VLIDVQFYIGNIVIIRTRSNSLQRVGQLRYNRTAGRMHVQWIAR